MVNIKYYLSVYISLGAQAEPKTIPAIRNAKEEHFCNCHSKKEKKKHKKKTHTHTHI